MMSRATLAFHKTTERQTEEAAHCCLLRSAMNSSEMTRFHRLLECPPTQRLVLARYVRPRSRRAIRRRNR
jgi:hypothetical protein